jgi:hypothetical protein
MSKEDLKKLYVGLGQKEGNKVEVGTDGKGGWTLNIVTTFGGPKKKKLAYGGIAGMLGEPTYADGGRIGFGKGKLADVARRKFLQLMGAGAAGVGAAKSGLFSLLKAGKPAQVLTSVPIKNISGMPAWFKPLVNKVIKEGDDVTKKFATQERQIVHKTELPDSKTDVIVTQDLNTGNVSVELGMTKHGFADGKFGQPKHFQCLNPVLLLHRF